MTNAKTYENYTNNSVYGPYYYYETGKTIYLHELNKSGKSNESCHRSTSTSADCNVGNDALNVTSYLSFDKLEKGWIHLNNNDSNVPAVYEWTMSFVGLNNNSSNAWFILYNGLVGDILYTNKSSARPIFYLESDVEFLGGTSTISDPYLLTEQKIKQRIRVKLILISLFYY